MVRAAVVVRRREGEVGADDLGVGGAVVETAGADGVIADTAEDERVAVEPPLHAASTVTDPADTATRAARSRDRARICTRTP